jgi:hypothetical protein
MGSSTHETSGGPKDHGDLTQIRGIGAVRKRWLNALGIDTIADLAQASAEAIDAKAKQDGRILSRDELEEWIAQAQVLCGQASLGSVETAERGEAAPNSIAQGAAPPDPTPEAGDWASIATFRVDYQTRQGAGSLEQRLIAHHLETQATEQWADFDTDQLQAWMRDRLAALLPALSSATPPPVMRPPVTPPPIAAEITQLRVMQFDRMSRPMVANKTSPIFPNAIYTADPFALEVSVQFAGQFAGSEQATPDRPVDYQVQCLARNVATGETAGLGDVTGQVSLAHSAGDTVLLPSLRLRQPGIYRLKVLVTQPQSPAPLGHFKVPVLQVV